MKSHLIIAMTIALAFHAHAQTWFGTSAPNEDTWITLASSSDGKKLAAASGFLDWSVYLSTDAGGTWTASAPGSAFNCLVSSSDGVNLAGAQEDDGFIFTSTNSGLTWTQTGAPQRYWYYMAGSTNGAKLAAIGEDGQPGPTRIYVSSDAGNTWMLTSAPDTNWGGIASSADGSKLVASVGGNGIFYTSIDSGTNWSPQTNVPNIWWGAVASSADGMKLAATTAGGGIYASTNAGTNWVQQSNAPDADWQVIASSADGSRLIAAVNPSGFGVFIPSPIYTSADSGATWISNNTPQELWTGVTISADGTQMAACSADISTNPLADIASQVITTAPELWMTSQQTNSDVIVEWPWPSGTFQLQQTLSLDFPNWLPVTNNPIVTNYQNQVLLPTNKIEGYFRLIDLH